MYIIRTWRIVEFLCCFNIQTGISQRCAAPAACFSGPGQARLPFPAFAGTWFSFPRKEGAERRVALGYLTPLEGRGPLRRRAGAPSGAPPRRFFTPGPCFRGRTGGKARRDPEGFRLRSSVPRPALQGAALVVERTVNPERPGSVGANHTRRRRALLRQHDAS